MDPRPRPSETEPARMLGEAPEAVERAEAPALPAPDGPARGVGRNRKRFEGALPLEDFLREIRDAT
ncbi:MAG TPA: hypothetical protein VFW06_10835 [Acidimicrobiia bacterium]|nr:hypothetical protein [Acidimicrobiia bacterium]